MYLIFFLGILLSQGQVILQNKFILEIESECLKATGRLLFPSVQGLFALVLLRF